MQAAAEEHTEELEALASEHNLSSDAVKGLQQTLLSHNEALKSTLLQRKRKR